jgi:hypothetical protein
MRETWKATSRKDSESSPGQTETNTKGIGKTTGSRAEAPLGTIRTTNLMDFSKITIMLRTANYLSILSSTQNKSQNSYKKARKSNNSKKRI